MVSLNTRYSQLKTGILMLVVSVSAFFAYAACTHTFIANADERVSSLLSSSVIENTIYHFDELEIPVGEKYYIEQKTAESRVVIIVDGAIDIAGEITSNGGIQFMSQSLQIHETGKIIAPHVYIDGGKDVFVQGNIQSAEGKITILGNEITVGSTAHLDVSGNRAGEIYIGGGFQGKESYLRNATHTFVHNGARIAANAIEGNGGRVVVWSDSQTVFFGNIEAKTQNGLQGGFVEVSGKIDLTYNGLVDVRAEAGETGTLLLDPTNVFIDVVNTNDAELVDNQVLAADGGAVDFDITAAAITTSMLAANTLIQATNDIIVNVNIDGLVAGSTNSLTLEAGNNLDINANITNGGAGDIVLDADQNIDIAAGVTISTVNGNIDIDANAAGNAGDFQGVEVNTGATITTTDGAITIDGTGGDDAVTNDHRGVAINAATISSTGAGTIAITGNGGDGTDGNTGVLIAGASTITSVNGNIAVNGTADGTTIDNIGIEMTGGVVSSTGTATIDLIGQGSVNGVNTNRGIFIEGATTRVTAVDSSISLNGTGGSIGDNNDGVLIDTGAEIEHSGNGVLTLTGVGAGAISDGVEFANGGFIDSQGNGNVTLNGTSAGAGTDIRFDALTFAKTGGTVTFTDTVNGTTLNANAGAYSISLLDGGVITNAMTFNNTVTTTIGDNQADTMTFIGGLVSEAPADTQTAGTIQTTNNTVTLGDITLVANTTLDSGATDLILNGTINGANNLQLNSTGNTDINGVIGGVTPIGTFDTNAGGTTELGANITTNNGAITFAEAVTLTAASTLDAGNANVTTSDTVDGDFAFTINTTGTTDIDGVIGGTTPVASFQTNAGGTTELGANITTNNGLITFGDNLTLIADVTLDAGNGNVTTSGTVDGNFAFVINTTGTTDINAGIGQTTPIATFTTNVGGVTELGGNVSTNDGLITFGNNVTLTANTTLEAGTANIVLNGTVDDNFDLVLNSTGTTDINAGIGQTTAIASFTTNAGGVTQLGGELDTNNGAVIFNDNIELTVDVRVRAGTGNITVNGTVDEDFLFRLNSSGITDINADIGATNAIKRFVTNAGGVTELGGNITTTNGAITFGDNVTLTASSTLEAGTANITFDGTIDGQTNLILNSTGLTDLNAGVGDTTLLQGFQTNAGGTTEIAGNITTQGSITLRDPVTLTGASILTTTLGTITVDATIDGNFALVMNTAGGTTDINQALGATIPLVSFETNATGVTELGADITTNNGAINIQDALTLTADVNLNAGTGNISTGSTVDGAFSFTLNTTGTTDINGAVGATTPLTSFETNAGGVTELGANVTTNNGLITFGDIITLTANSTLDAGNANVTLASAVDGNFAFVINTTGTTDINAAIGATTPVAAFQTNAGGTTELGANITTNNGLVTFGDNVTLTADATIDAGNANVTTNGTVDGNFTFVINTTGTTDINGAIGATTPVAAFQTNAGGTTELGANVTTNNGLVTFGDNVTLTADATIDAGNANVTTNGTVDGNFTFVINTTGTTDINAAIGATTPVAAFQTNAGGTTELGANITTNNGLVTFGDNVTLTADATIDAGNANVTTNGTVDGNFTFVINTTGTTDINAAIGATTPVASFQTNAGGTTNFGADISTNNGVITFNDDVTFEGDRNVVTGTADITFNGQIIDDGVAGTGTLTFDENVNVNADAVVNLTGDATNNQVTIGAGVTLTGNIDLAAGSDDLIFGDGADNVGTLDGGVGTDVVDFSAFTAAINESIDTYTNFENLIGGTQSDTITKAAATNWNITGVNEGNDGAGFTFTAIENIDGGVNNDTFTFADAGSLAGDINGAGGTDEMIGDADGNAFTVTGVNQGNIAGKVNEYTNIENLTGGAAIDTFTFENAGSHTGTLNGAGDNDELIGDDDGNVFNISGDDAGDVTGKMNVFINIENLDGGAGQDDYIFTNNSTLSGTITNGLGNTDTLTGTGTITGALAAANGSTTAPGASAGIINTGNIALNAGAVINIEVDDIVTAGTDFDRINVTGTIDLGGATFNLLGAHIFASGDSVVVITNDGVDAITGEFNGLPEGTVFQLNGVDVRISYVGGDGNDIEIFEAVPPEALFDPEDGATKVSKTPTITITFNEPIRNTDGSAIDDTNVADLILFKKGDLVGNNDHGFSITIDATKQIITINPNGKLKSSSLYFLQLAAVEDAFGNESAVQAISFTTQGGGINPELLNNSYVNNPNVSTPTSSGGSSGSTTTGSGGFDVEDEEDEESTDSENTQETLSDTTSDQSGNESQESRGVDTSDQLEDESVQEDAGSQEVLGISDEQEIAEKCSIDIPASEFESIRGLYSAIIDGQNVLIKDVPADAWFTEVLDHMVKRNIISGYRNKGGQPLGLMGPGDNVTYGQIAKMVVMAADISLPENHEVLATKHWAEPYVVALKNNGVSLFQGLQIELYDTAVKRSVVARIIAEGFGVETTQAVGGVYSDVSEKSAHAAHIEALTKHCVISGDKGKDTFRPNDNINRAETSAMIMRALIAFLGK